MPAIIKVYVSLYHLLKKNIYILNKNIFITFILGNPIPTMKLAIQLTNTAIAIALGLGPCENSSAVISQGIDPGPTAKNTTKLKVETTDR